MLIFGHPGELMYRFILDSFCPGTRASLTRLALRFVHHRHGAAEIAFCGVAASQLDGKRASRSFDASRGTGWQKDYALMWILWRRFRKAYAVPGGWGGTDPLGILSSFCREPPGSNRAIHLYSR